MSGKCLITGTLATYPGASIVARFVAQGGGAPAIASASATLDANGHFSLEGWDNTNAAYAPSLTQFTLRSVGGADATYYSTQFAVAGSSMDISTNLSGAPTPPSATGVPSVNGVTDAVTIAAGSNLAVATAGDTVTLSGTVGPKNPDQGSAVASGTFSTITLGTSPIAKSIEVTINGLALNPATAYAVSGSAITLTTPGAITNVVVVSWLTASTPTGSVTLS